jgi:hypothetical protein
LKNNVLIDNEDVGGVKARTMCLEMATGKVWVKATEKEIIELLSSRTTGDTKMPGRRAAMDLSPIKAHRKRCLKCVGGSYKAVRDCPETDCESYPYRLGKNPHRRGVGGNPLLKGKIPQIDSHLPT